MQRIGVDVGIGGRKGILITRLHHANAGIGSG